ncbi:serine/threonine-protein kinase [Nannocystis sp. ILAH1]|uniref:protein kinase domain-containing protein n=1 Tax=unclassified Nannocystis TaxID=2627009 RepID=UPI0022712D10|nr:serine/threonine-protein kinase [Nannocystis sp. ILAH1]MCY1064456.1 serine/threonine-protein kinase [Nannocystis sp. RBIL2]
MLRLRIAVKWLRRDLAQSERLRRRFLREARAVAAVKHPNVVEILDVARDDAGDLYLVMEFVEGEPLNVVLRRDGRLPWSRASILLGQLARALEHAHAQGVVHRDLKPSNIIVQRAGTCDESVKIIDFGLATRHADDGDSCDITHAGDVFGSPGYMSPEQLRSEPVDARADVYALGCIAFEMLCGRKPFVGPTAADLVAQHLTEPPPIPTSFLAEAVQVPAIQDLIVHALCKDPAERYASVAAFAEDMAAIGRTPARAPHRIRRRAPVMAAVGALSSVFAWVWFPSHPSPIVAEATEVTEVPPFTRAIERPIDRPTPQWPDWWLGADLRLSEPRRDFDKPDRTGPGALAGEVVLWGDDPRRSAPYRIVMERKDAFTLSHHAVRAGLTLGHAVDEPDRAEHHERGGNAATGRVYWRDPREFPLRAIGTTQIGPGCTGVQVGPVHILTAAQCVWTQGGFARPDRRWQAGDARGDETDAVDVIRVYVPEPWPQNERPGLSDWAVAIAERRLGDEHFGVTALADEALLGVMLQHKGYPIEQDATCDVRSPVDWLLGAGHLWGNPDPLEVTARALRAPSPISGWDRVLGTAASTSTGHAGGPYYFYDASDRPVVVAIHRSACSDADGGSAEFCGYHEPWRCGMKQELTAQAMRLEPEGLYGHILPVLTWWGVDADGRATCLLDGGC